MCVCECVYACHFLFWVSLSVDIHKSQFAHYRKDSQSVLTLADVQRLGQNEFIFMLWVSERDIPFCASLCVWVCVCVCLCMGVIRCHQVLIRSKLLFVIFRILMALSPKTTPQLRRRDMPLDYLSLNDNSWRSTQWESYEIWAYGEWILLSKSYRLNHAACTVKLAKTMSYNLLSNKAIHFFPPILLAPEMNSRWIQPLSPWWYFDFSFPFPVYHSLIRSPHAVTCSIQLHLLKRPEMLLSI